MPFRLPAPSRAALARVLALGAVLAAAPLDAQNSTTSRSAPAESADAPAARTRSKKASVGSKAAKDTTRKKSATGARTSKRKRAEAAAGNEPTWPPPMPDPLPGSILPAKRIVAYYGNPLSKRMGILGELPPEQMLARLDREVEAWTKADSTTPVQPALHLITVVAQGAPGRDGKYRLRMADSLIEHVATLAAKRNALVFLDVQVGKSTLQEELPRLVPFLKRPNVHLGIDPEFSMKFGDAPGRRIGTYDAADVNYASQLLADLVTENNLPPKVLVVHRFTRDMLTHSSKIRLDPRVQIVINMDGWGPPWMKQDSYHDYVYLHPVQYTGFKLFYHNDTKKKGSTMMTPREVLALTPKPLYIQYQ